MNNDRYKTIVYYLYELEQYREHSAKDTGPKFRHRIWEEIERCRKWLYNHIDEKGNGKRDVFHGFYVDTHKEYHFRRHEIAQKFPLKVAEVKHLM